MHYMFHMLFSWLFPG